MRTTTLTLLLAGATLLGSTPQAVLFDHTKREDAGSSAYWVICNGHEPDPSPANPTKETDWNGGISSWAFDIHAKGYKVQTLPMSGGRITYGDSTNAQDLSNYAVYIVPECYYLFTAAEKQAIYAFVQNGGGLYLMGNHFGSTRLSSSDKTSTDAVHVFNDLAVVNGTNVFGFTFVQGHGPGESAENTTSNAFTTAVNPVTQALLHGPNGQVTEMDFHAYSYLSVNTAQNPSVQPILATQVAGDTGYFIVACTYGKGRIVAITDSAPEDDGTTTTSGKNLYVDYSTYTNRQFFLNAVDWLAGTGTANTVTAAITSPASDQTVASGTSVAFAGTGTDSASGTTLAYAWTFGDGGTASGASASHTFTNTGASSVTDTVTLTVTDTTGAAGTATRKITVAPPATVAVSVSPASVTLAPGAQQAFTATVVGTTNTAVTWSANGGSITTAGLFTAPANAGSCTVTATSVADTTKSATASVTVTSSAGSSLSETFETGTKAAYATGTVSLATGTWTFNDALLAPSSTDHADGKQCARVRNSGKLTMGFDFPTGAKTVTLSHAKYGSDGSSTWSLWYSTNGGSSWTQAGSAVTTSSTTLTQAAFTVNVSGPIRFEVRKTDGSSNRIDFDDFKIAGY